ncbi:MAG TPA: hypothetical protein VF715_14090 [Thermoleophilaceae bacterium]|jgi:hypothetical protein
MRLARHRLARILCAGVVLAFGVAGCGGDDGPSEEELREAREQGEKEGRDREKLRDLERRLREREKEDRGGGSSPPSSGGSPSAPRRTSCGGGLEVGPNTSCAFARNVRDEYNSSGGSGSMTITAHSPATGKVYTMSCTGGSPHVCTGGNNASVYFP